MSRLSLFVLAALVSLCCALSPSTTLTATDRDRLQQVLEPGWQLTDLSLVMYAASGYKHLGIKVPDQKAACTYATGFAGSDSIEVLFQAASAAHYLGCPITPTGAVKQSLVNAISDSSSLVEVYHAVLALSRMGVKPDAAKVLAVTQAALKRDDSVLNLGYAFHIGSAVAGEASALYDRIEDAVVQADEVDGRLLQFEGGLSITALVVDGAYQLCQATNKPAPLRPEQAVKFANYLLSRKSVQLPKGVHYLLHALTMFTTNKHHMPVSISLASSVAVSAAHPKVQVSVTDLLGNSIGAGVSVVADSVTRETDGKEVASAVPLTAAKGSETVFTLDAMSLKPGRGFYRLTVTASGDDKRLVGNVAAALKLKVLTSVSVERVEFGTADADQSSPPALKPVSFGSKLAGGPLDADRHQKVLMKFTVRDSATGQPTRVHQAFVRITHTTTGREIIYVAEPDGADNYKFDMVVATSQAEFKSISGVYSVELIIGDASISNPMRWHFADINLNFPQTKSLEEIAAQDYTYKPKPEIQHVFQVPDKRPSALVSTVFTGLCVLPLLLLLVLWAKLGMNVSNFPISLTALGFHLGIGGIFALFCLFWLQLNMFSTLRYLFMIGIVTFYCGNNMLSKIAAIRKESSK